MNLVLGLKPAYLRALEPRLSPAQPGKDRWGELHRGPCRDTSSSSFPYFYHSSLLFFVPRVASLLLSPTFSCFSSTQLLFPRFRQGLLLFPPPPLFLAYPESQSCCDYSRKEMTNSWSVSSTCLVCFVLSSPWSTLYALHSHFSEVVHLLVLWQRPPGFCITSPKRKCLCNSTFFPSSWKKAVRVGRSMSPPRGNMLNHNKLDWWEVTVTRQLIATCFGVKII